jgi:hypothetical protein
MVIANEWTFEAKHVEFYVETEREVVIQILYETYFMRKKFEHGKMRKLVVISGYISVADICTVV